MTYIWRTKRLGDVLLSQGFSVGLVLDFVEQPPTGVDRALGSTSIFEGKPKSSMHDGVTHLPGIFEPIKEHLGDLRLRKLAPLGPIIGATTIAAFNCVATSNSKWPHHG